jgi:DNA gyrase subunit A
MNKELDMTQVINDSFTSYAGAVLQSRALVDVRDCIKPSARQIFYCMYNAKLWHNKPHRKTQTALGEAMKVYIHGDASLEGVIMRASQNFTMRYPLVETKGNNGNLTESGNWAASRYTEAWLSPINELMFTGIDKNTITDWRDNFDDTMQYPGVLPSKGFYNIINGTFGIGIGAGSSIPQFNLKEVNAAMEKLLLNPDVDFDEIYCAPDFATGAYLLNANQVKQFLKEGQGGSCKLRSKIEYDVKDNCLVVTEIPFGVYTNTICGELEKILDDESNPGIERFNDLTHTTPLIKIYLKKKVQPTEVEQYLYKHTSLQTFYGINMTMLEDGKYPKVFGWREALQAHINHEIEVYRKEYEFDIEKMKARVHVIDGLLICLAAIDEVIKTIKESGSTKEAKENLIKNFLLDDEQAKAVLAMKLSSLAKLEVEKLYDEKLQLVNKINELMNILNDIILLNKEVIKTWRAIAEKYGDERRTKVIEDFDEEKEEVPEDVFIVATGGNEIKTVPFNEFSVSSRNSKGNKKDEVIAYLPTRTDKDILVFTANGKYQRIKVKDARTGIYFNDEDKIVNIIDVNEGEPYFIFVTKNGLMKKVESSQYASKRYLKKPSIAMKLKDGDAVVNVLNVNDEHIIAIATENGKFAQIKINDFTTTSKNSGAIKGMSLENNDSVIAVENIKKKDNYIIFVTEKGYGKKVENKFEVHSRGTKGYMIGLGKGDKLVAIASVTDADQIIISGNPNSICLAVRDFPLINYTGIGNKLIKNSTILSAIKK